MQRSILWALAITLSIGHLGTQPTMAQGVLMRSLPNLINVTKPQQTKPQRTNLHRTKPIQRSLASIPSFRIPQGTADDPVSVYLMAGQSNLVGAALLENLEPLYGVPFPMVRIWDNTASFVSLSPGFEGQFVNFGPEHSFGRRLVAGTHEAVYVVKYGLGATTLAENWAPNGINNSYDRFTEIVDAALTELTRQGINYEIRGLVWMQGESDVWNASFAATYAENLTKLIESLRTRYGDNLVVAIGLIRDDLPADNRKPLPWVRAAQRSVAEADSQVLLVDTDALGEGAAVLQTDAVHYNAAGQVLLGNAFADALLTFPF